MVGIALIAVLVCALFLVPNVYAKAGIFCSVPEEGDYRSRFTYTINITNPGGACSGEVRLIVGSDYYNPNIKNEWSLREMETSCGINDNLVTIPANGYCLINKSVCFITDPKLYQEDFRDWAENPESSFWDKAWYKCCFIKTWPPFPPEPPVCEEGDVGKPVLTNNITKFYESSWKYNKTGCPDKLLFDYNVRVWQNANNTIELKVFNYSTYRFESKGPKNCTTLFANHTLGWPGINLDRNNFENLEGQYMFKVVGGQTDKQSNTYTGPEIREEFKDPNVTFQKGTSTFIYNVTVNANICDKIELQVFNYTKDDLGEYPWDSKGTGNYTMPLLTDQNLIWPDVNLTHDNLGEEYKGRYRFVGCNKSSDEGHIGPEIEEKFDNSNVNYNGTIDNKLSFDYEVEATVTMVNDDNIRLEVLNFCTGKWEPKGDPCCTTIPGEPRMLRWGNMNLTCCHFDDHLQGKYRFNGSYEISRNFTEPTIEEEFSNLNVTPKEGTNNDTFTYSVMVNASICDKIALEFRNHRSGNWTPKRTQDYTTPGVPDTLVWHNITLNDYELNPLNDARYRFVGFCNRSFSDEEGKESPFWETGLEWDNISVEPERGLWNAKSNYCIRMYAKRNLSVELVVYYPSSKEIAVREIKNYTRIYNFQTICWNNTQPFKWECEGDASYMFIFYRKGVYINETAEHVGPYVGIAEFENSSVKPEIGTCETEFNYFVRANAFKNGKVYLEIQCPNTTGWNLIDPYYEYSPSGFEPFYWNNIRLPCDCKYGIAKYRFKFVPKEIINVSETYSNESGGYGPEIIEEKFRNEKVFPKKGTEETSFNFSVDVKASKNETINLSVSCDEGPWEVISNITIPYDINLSWRNNSCTPSKGWCTESYNYSIDVKAEKSGTVELQIKSKDDWEPKGERKPYNKTSEWQQAMNWTNISECGEYEGNTSYKFVFYLEGKYNNETISYTGPKLFIPVNISFTEDLAEPDYGVYYNFKDDIFNDTSSTLFNFSINVTADKPTTLKLVLTDPCGEKHNMTEECKYTTPHQPQECSWRMIGLPSGQAGKWNYTFLYYDTRLYYDTGDGWKMSNKTFKGPEIIAVFENYTLDPEPPIPYGKPCDVTVCMKGTEEMNVTLEAFNLWPGHKNWTIIEPLKQYEPPGEECLNWTIDTFKVPFDKLRLIWKVI
jgi:hypothetical protein